MCHVNNKQGVWSMYNKIIKEIKSENFKFIAIITIIFMLAAHGFVYLNTIFSHDSMKIIYWGESLSYDTLEIGRFTIPILLLIRGKYYPPFLIGMLSIIFMILLIYFLVKLFSIKDKKYMAILSSILSTSCTITLLNATYIEYSDMYIFSFLLATLSSYLLLKSKSKLKVPLSIILFVIAMGIYQTTLPIFVVLIIISTILEVLKKNNIKNTFIKFFKNMSIGAIASGLYLVTYKVTLKILNIAPSDKYNSVNSLAKYNTLNDIFNAVKNQYNATINFIIHPSTYYKKIVIVLNISLIVLALLLVLLTSIKRKKTIVQNIFLVILILGLTFSINCTFFFSNGTLHQLMIFPMFILYMFLIVLIEKLLEYKVLKSSYLRVAHKFMLVSFAFITLSSIIYSNQVYLKKQMEFESTKLTMNRIIERMESVEKYNVQTTPVVFIGYLKDGPLAYKKPDLDYDSVGLWSPYSITYYLNYKQFLNNYMGYPVNVLDKEASLQIAQKEEVQKMEAFPSKKSIKMVDDVLVIKMGPYSY